MVSEAARLAEICHWILHFGVAIWSVFADRFVVLRRFALSLYTYRRFRSTPSAGAVNESWIPRFPALSQ